MSGARARPGVALASSSSDILVPGSLLKKLKGFSKTNLLNYASHEDPIALLIAHQDPAMQKKGLQQAIVSGCVIEVRGASPGFFLQVHSVSEDRRAVSGRWLQTLERVFQLYDGVQQLQSIPTWYQQLVITAAEAVVQVRDILGLVTVSPRWAYRDGDDEWFVLVRVRSSDDSDTL